MEELEDAEDEDLKAIVSRVEVVEGEEEDIEYVYVHLIRGDSPCYDEEFEKYIAAGH